MVNIHVTHHDNTLISGVIPFLVVVAQLLIFKVIHHAHQSNGETSAIFRTRIEFREVAFEHSAACASAQTPLFVYHSAFLVNFFRVERKVTSPVAQNQKTGVEGALASSRHVIDVVHRFVDGGVRIEVGTEFHAQTFAIAQ